MNHHDEYDSRTSQSKGITQHELLEYKSRLNSAISAGLLGNQSKVGVTEVETEELRRDRIVIEPFWGVIGTFWARLRLMMFGVGHANHLEDEVREVFGLNVAITEGSVDVDRIDKRFIERLFRSVDFSTNSNAIPGDGGHLLVLRHI